MVGDFCAFPAFDETYNPLVDFWYALGASVGQYLPIQWFVMFEEASRKEREGVVDSEDDRSEIPCKEKPNAAHILFSDKRAHRAIH